MKNNERIFDFLIAASNYLAFNIEDYYICDTAINFQNNIGLYQVDFNHKILNSLKIEGFGLTYFYKITYKNGDIIFMDIVSGSN